MGKHFSLSRFDREHFLFAFLMDYVFVSGKKKSEFVVANGNFFPFCCAAHKKSVFTFSIFIGVLKTPLGNPLPRCLDLN